MAHQNENNQNKQDGHDDQGLEALRKRLEDERHKHMPTLGPKDYDLLSRYHEKVHELERLHHEFTARMDTAFPGSDLARHREDHEDINELRIKSINFWKDVRSRVVSGVIIAVIAVLSFSVLQNIIGTTGVKLW